MINTITLKKVSYVEGLHGRKGVLRVALLEPSTFNIGHRIYFIDSQGREHEEKIFEARNYKNGKMLLKLVGLKWRGAVEKYLGCDICV